MKKKFIAIITVVLIILLVLGYNIMTSGTHYSSKDSDGNEISFNYPNGWAFQERTPGELIQGEKNSTENTTNRSVVTITRISANGTSMDQVKNNNIYFTTGKVFNETNRSIDGVQATVLDIDEMGGPERGKLGEVKLVIFSKDNYIYTISFVTGGSLENLKSDIDHILNSFQTGS
ncbi:PsbP-related protein [Methanobacterium formicicum]|uniref:Uncharacterized protein n=1 Tax=Methanobacterium formicicum (strain DSM 3637 / PP1) TaxID=1204725 RepID=K2RUR5_METFP|nr:PsbP-related protein [Methanobacterium formicicum]EKF86515.1 hypothetical protein A994_03493 [Methanobacterium formicicum DSM 3637]